MTDMAEFYQNKGYAIKRNCLSASVVKELITLTDQLENDLQLRAQYPSHYRFEASNASVIRRISSPEIIMPHYLELIKQSGVLQIVRELLGPNVRLERIKIHNKVAQYGSAIPLSPRLGLSNVYE